MSESAAALADIAEVSRETLVRLETFVGLLRRWQGAQNLVAVATLNECLAAPCG